MRQRTLWILIGSVSTLIVLVCVAIGAFGFWFVRQQQQQLNNITAQINATLQASAAQSQTPVIDATPSATATRATTEDATPTTPAVVTELPAQPTPSSVPSSTPTDVTTVVIAGSGQFPNADVSASLVAASKPQLTAHPNATLYRISATLDADQKTITGEQRVKLTNTEDRALDALYFRLYVNAPHYNEGDISVSDVRINGSPVQTTLEGDDTTLKIALGQPLARGQSLEIDMRFTTTVPSSGGGYGIFNEDQGIFALYNWHPELAVYEGGAWLLNPVSDQGDPTNTDASNYVVKFTAPKAYTVITSGVQVNETASGDELAHTFVAALTRNFVVVTSDRFTSASQQVGEVKVTSYYLPNDSEGGKTTLETTAKSIKLFSQEFGAYPYTEIDVAEVKLGGGAAGMEATGLIMIGSDYYDPQQANPLGGMSGLIEGAAGANALVFTTAHEVAHQWWYSVVGSDAYKQPWLDESLTNWSSVLYVERTEGDVESKLARDLFIDLPYRETLNQGDQRLDQQVDQFDANSYGAIVYGKGALMYDVLRKQLGDQKFFAFLRRYYQEQQFDRADSTEWLNTLNQAAGQDMTPFYRKWVEGEQIRESDLPPGGPLSDLLGGNMDSLLPESSPAP